MVQVRPSLRRRYWTHAPASPGPHGTVGLTNPTWDHSFLVRQVLPSKGVQSLATRGFLGTHGARVADVSNFGHGALRGELHGNIFVTQGLPQESTEKSRNLSTQLRRSREPWPRPRWLQGHRGICQGPSLPDSASRSRTESTQSQFRRGPGAFRRALRRTGTSWCVASLKSSS